MADAEVSDELAQEPRRTSRVLAACIGEHSGTLTARRLQLERTVGRSASLWRRYRPLIIALRDLDDPGSEATQALAREVCLGLSLSVTRGVPWARRL